MCFSTPKNGNNYTMNLTVMPQFVGGWVLDDKEKTYSYYSEGTTFTISIDREAFPP